MAISQQSLDVRLQKLICCIGDLAGQIADSLAIGGCYTEKLQKLKILNGYLEALKCYSIEDEDINATGTLTLTGVASSDLSIEVLVNGISISGIYNTTSTVVGTQASLLTAAINSYQSAYTAVHTIGTGIITITGICSDDPLTVDADEGITITATGLTGGHCSTNCLTEEQVLEMFERVSKYCNICFPSAEYNFTNSLYSTTPIE